ncbi:histidine kinase [Pedobacter yulinensis]|uniref:histidine kinase n=1 Tax=Pedobacter yulinensis TaxID=2126353 RepID=A0A2T3HGH9_9SPHI|nr:PAS domain S-box protein [Pedobacter yulinensis]PST81556.1 histidine kinase [Pedobacter yulinensis]
MELSATSSGNPGTELVRAFENAAIPVFFCNSMGAISFSNEAAHNLLGRRPAKDDRWNIPGTLFEPDGRPVAPENHPLAVSLSAGRAVAPAEFMIRCADSGVKFVVIHCAILESGESAAGGYYTLTDITAYKNSTQDAVLSAIVESSEDAIISKDLQGNIRSWNKGAERVFGYTADEVVGKHISILIPARLQQEEETIINSIRRGEKIDHFQTRRLHKNGHEIDISLTVSPVKDKFGNIYGASKVARDITERIVGEESRARSAERILYLNTIGRTLSESLDLQEILQKVTDLTTSLTGAQFGAFFYNQVDKKGETMTLFTLSGAPREAFEKFGFPRNTAVFHPTFSGHGVIRVDDITKDDRYGKNAPHYGMPQGHLPVTSYLAVPVISSAGNVAGGLFFGHPEPGVFKEEHEDLVTGIASQAAIAIDNSKLFEEVKTLSHKKDEFIAMATHELKTPLTSMTGYLQMLQLKISEPGQRLFVDKAMNQVRKLNAMITDLFDISKIQAGKLQLNYSRFAFFSFLREIIESLRTSGMQHQVHYEQPAEVFIEADKLRLEQVLSNLLTNAAKYSPDRKQIELSFEVSDQLTVHVQDRGLGMEPEHINNIFNQFYRVESVPRNISGLGLGLFISKEIVERHHGSIWVKSVKGEGSVFSFRIPLAPEI